MRPRQWVKNVFVFAPLIFSGEFASFSAILTSISVTFAFCVASSAAYIVNDLLDIESDRLHPKKSISRPLASGAITVPFAFGLLFLLYCLLMLFYLLFPSAGIVIFFYVGLNILYSLVLKHQPVLDIFSIAVGFVLRVYAGMVALSTPISQWMLITTLCLALFLASIKRRQELRLVGRSGRSVLAHYSPMLMDKYAEMSATGAIIFYSIFVLSAKPILVPTIPLVLFGLFRYWYRVELMDEGESPTDALFSDCQLIGAILLWAGCCTWALWPSNA